MQVKNFTKLIGGATLAQVIPILISPILTRIYSEEDFGLYGAYYSLVILASILTVGKLDMAVHLPKTNTKALFVATNGFIFTSIICGISLIFCGIMILFSQTTENIIFAVLVIASTLVNTYIIIGISVLNRLESYGGMSRVRVINATNISLFQLLLTFIKSKNITLILGDFIGRIITLVLIIRIEGVHKLLKYKWRYNLALFHRYKHFILYETPASLFNSAAHQIPIIVIPIYFGARYAGLYFLVYRVMMVPISIIGNSLLELYRNRVRTDVLAHGDCYRSTLSLLVILTSITIIPFLIIFLYAQDIFEIVFGAEWRMAGYIAQILSPMMVLRFISSPLSYMFIFREKLKLDMILQAIFLTAIISTFVFAGEYSDPNLLIKLISVIGVLFYIVQIIFSLIFSRSRHSKLCGRDEK